MKSWLGPDPIFALLLAPMAVLPFTVFALFGWGMLVDIYRHPWKYLSDEGLTIAAGYVVGFLYVAARNAWRRLAARRRERLQYRDGLL